VGCLMLLWGFCEIFGVSVETGMFGVALEILWDI
jgi:hypothetical protein